MFIMISIRQIDGHIMTLFLSFSFRLLGVSLLVARSLVTSAFAQSQAVPVNMFWQETNEWCWAATGQAVMDTIGWGYWPSNAPQCYQANEELSRTDCCTCPTPSACVKPGHIQFDKWNFTALKTPQGTALSWNAVMNEINNGKPFTFSWKWNRGGGHAMVAYGFVVGSPNMIYVADPWPPPHVVPAGSCAQGNASGPFGGDFVLMSYAEFVGGPGWNYTHGVDNYNIAHK